MKHPNDSEACFKEEMLEQEIELTASAMVLQSPLEEEFDNVTKCIVSENEGEELASIEELYDPQSQDLDKTWVVNGQRLKLYHGGEFEKANTILNLISPIEVYASS